MSDLNNFFVGGEIIGITHDNKGYASIKIKSNRETQSKKEDLIIPVAIWGEKIGQAQIGDYVIAQGYINARMVQRKDGSGSFPSLSIVASSISIISSNKDNIETQQTFGDDEIPF